MLADVIARIFKDPCLQFDALIADYETFEEPLLVNSYPEIEAIAAVIGWENLNSFLFNLALAHLQNTILYAKSKLTAEEFARFFICIICEADEYEPDSGVQEFGCYLYRFFVSRKNDQFKFDEKIQNYPLVNAADYPVIQKTLADLKQTQVLDVRLESWADSLGLEIKRLFFVYR